VIGKDRDSLLKQFGEKFRAVAFPMPLAALGR